MNNSMQLQVYEVQEARPALMQMLSQWVIETQVQGQKKKKRGRPQEVCWEQIGVGLLVSVLFGMENYQQLWRRLRRKGLAGYEPIKVQDDAIIKRLKQAGTEPLEALFQQQRQVACGQENPLNGCPLAGFAKQIVALDEMTGEQMQRHLKEQRQMPAGDKRLLPGKLAGRLNLRSQQWELVQWRSDAQANCKENVLSLLQGLERGSLILFDLGYFSFAWFDYLSERGYWWVSRLREKTSYELEHTYYRYEGNLDALVWLGAYRSNRGGKLVRLVRFWDGEHLHTYLTNVLDPHQLSMKEVAQLYARRWDIELAFLLLKKYLGLHHWWSSQPVLMQQQCLAVLVVAQALQGLRLQIAAQAGVEAFAVSLPLVVELLPELLMEQQEPLNWMREHAKDLKLIRASSRLEPQVPQVREEDLKMPEGALKQQRKARYPRYGEKAGEGEGDATVSKTGSAKKRRARKEEKRKKEEEGKREEKGGEEGKKEERGKGGKKEKQEKGRGQKKEKTEGKREQKGRNREGKREEQKKEEKKEEKIRKGMVKEERDQEQKREEVREKIRKKLRAFYEQQEREKSGGTERGGSDGREEKHPEEGISRFSG